MNGVNETNKSNEMITADRIEAVKQEGQKSGAQKAQRKEAVFLVYLRQRMEKRQQLYYRSVHFKRMMHGKQRQYNLCFLKVQLA